MSETALPPPSRRAGLGARLNRLLASPGFQSFAARTPFLRRQVRREGAALFDLLAGFCKSQSLMALVDLRIPEMLLDGAMSADTIAARCGVPIERMQVLLRANAAVGLLKVTRPGDFALTARGAALAGVPGLREMILHQQVLYRDLADPTAFFRGETETELADFWPYVFGAGGQGDPKVAARYSALMRHSLALVAEDTLAAVDLRATRTLMDIGGGTGAFVIAACMAAPHLNAVLFDLPDVVVGAPDRLDRAGIDSRVAIAPGSFRDDPLPVGADTISLIRVLYDHADDTVAALLAKIYAALPPGGRLIVSEPMTGGARPTAAGDGYFALYTMAMRTGKTRSPDEVSALCCAAGFGRVTVPSVRRPFVTSVVIAEKSCQRKLTDETVRLN